MSTGDLPNVFTITLSRPRWLMPMIDRSAPSSAARFNSSSRNGISAVTPSSENRFVPR